MFFAPAALRSDGSGDCPGTANRWGATAEPPGFSMAGGFAVNARGLRKRAVAVIYLNKYAVLPAPPCALGIRFCSL